MLELALPPDSNNAFQYGVFPLTVSDDEDKLQFLYFGGRGPKLVNMTRTCTFTTSVSNFKDSKTEEHIS